MRLLDALSERREALADRWGELVLATYPRESVTFLRNEKDRFKNPVGSAIRRELRTLSDGLLDGAAVSGLSGSLEGIVKIRAVQAFTPGEALGFVCLFRRAALELLGEELSAVTAADLAELDARLDALASASCDLYVACRERLFAIRASSARARTYSLLKRAGLLSETEEEGTGPRVEGRS